MVVQPARPVVVVWLVAPKSTRRLDEGVPPPLSVLTIDSSDVALSFPEESKAVAMNPYDLPARRLVMVRCGAAVLDGSPEKTGGP